MIDLIIQSASDTLNTKGQSSTLETLFGWFNLINFIISIIGGLIGAIFLDQYKDWKNRNKTSVTYTKDSKGDLAISASGNKDDLKNFQSDISDTFSNIENKDEDQQVDNAQTENS